MVGIARWTLRVQKRQIQMTLKYFIGQLIAVAFQNNLLQLTSAHTGKAIHQMNFVFHSTSQICCLGWSINSTANQRTPQSPSSLGHDTSLDDLLTRRGKTLAPDEAPDLPADLAFLDVESLLPRLSPLALGGVEYVLVFYVRL